MKLWQKIYICVLIVFIIALDLGAFSLLHKSYDLNSQMETERGINQFNNIEKTLSYVLENYEKATSTPNVKLFISNFATQYLDDKTLIEVYDENEELLFSNAFRFDGKREEISADKISTVYRKLNGTLYLFTGGGLEYNNLRLVITYDVNYLQDYFHSLLMYFIMITVVLSIVLSALLILLVRKLTLPIVKLNKAAGKIAQGAYDMRVDVKSKDEIGEFALNFNKMAEAVSKYVADLKKSSDEKEVFINNLTHELKTPITAIKGYSAFLNDANCNEEEKHLAIDYILEHINRLNLLSTKLMELLYLKNETFDPKLVDIEKMFDSVKKIEQHSLMAKNITLKTDNIIKNIMGDEILLQAMIINLIENSVKASGENGEILLKGCYRDGNAVITVTDYGIGIAKDQIDKLTNAFYTVDFSRSKASGGIGLGLSICKLIAQLHHGEIHISSEQNKYTAITVTFYN